MTLKDGIFASYRSMGINVSSNPYFTVSEPTSSDSVGYGYCGHKDIHAGLVPLIMGDDMSTAWVNRESESPDNKYVDFRFLQNKVSVQGIAIQTLCAPPNKILFQGSNDKGSTWETVCERDAAFPNDNIVEVVCFHHKHFSWFRLSQIGKNTGAGSSYPYRFHIYKFEIYEANSSLIHATCIRKRCAPSIVYLFMFTQIFEA